MPGYDVTAPGAAFSNAIDKQLLEMQTAKRQAMLDSLAAKRDAETAKYHQQEIDIRHQELADRLEARRDTQGEKAKGDYEKNVLGKMVAGDIPDQETFAQGEKLGFPMRIMFPGGSKAQAGTAPVVAPPPEMLAAPPEAPVEGQAPMAPLSDVVAPGMPAVAAKPGIYVGNPQERLAVQARDREKALGAKIATAKNRQEAVSMALDAGVPYAQVDDVINAHFGKANKPVVLVDHTGTFRDAITKQPVTDPAILENSQIVHIPAPPAAKEPAMGADEMMATFGPQGFDMLAKKMAQGGEPPAFGMMSKGEKVKLLGSLFKRASEYNAETGEFVEKGQANPNVPDLTAAKARAGALSATATQLEKNLGSIQAFSDTAKKNIEELKSVVDKVPDFGSTPLNAIARTVVGSTTLFGTDRNAAQKKFEVFRKSLQSEYQRLTESANLAGVPMSDASQAHQRALTNPNLPISGLMAAFSAFEKEASNREGSLANQIKKTYAQLKGPKGDHAKETLEERNKRLGIEF